MIVGSSRFVTTRTSELLHWMQFRVGCRKIVTKRQIDLHSKYQGIPCSASTSKKTFFWHFTWILTTPLIALHNIGWEKKFYFIVTEMSSWQLSKKKKKCNWTSKKSLETFDCPWTSRLSNFSDAFIEAISIYSAGFKKEMIAILNTLDLSFWLCKMSPNFVETDNTSVFGS